VDAVLRATLEELAAAGWADFQIDAVAARAGVHKTTIYRRWPTRGALVQAALTATPFRSQGSAVPDTGTVRGDLAVLTDDLVAVWRVPRTAKVARAVLAARHDPEVATAWNAYWSEQMRRVKSTVRQAQRRGEVPTEVDPEFVAEVYLGTAFAHLIEVGHKPTPRWAALLLDVACAAAHC
jgi:AcrR family transcriptional regulator